MKEEEPKHVKTPAPPAETGAANVDYKDAWMRARADYENFRKETEQKKGELARFARAQVLEDLLPVLQHFSQALKFIPAEQAKASWVVGIKHIQTLFHEFLEKNDLKVIETVGKKFDPRLHQPVGTKKLDGVAPDQIIEEVSPGYLIGPDVLQVAKVIVSE